MLRRYICSLPNPGTKGIVREIFYNDDAFGHTRAENFAQRENIPGRGVYDCIGVLQDDARVRRKETVSALDCVIADLDLKNIVEPRDQVLQCLRNLRLPPAEIRDSGYGLHGVWRLKEPVSDAAGLARAEHIMKRLAELLAGDPAPTHRAALLRRPGTNNSKNGSARLCHIIEQNAGQFDVTELEDMLDLYGGRQLLTRTGQPDGQTRTSERKAPIDVDARLDAAEWHGPGDTAFNITVRDTMASLLRHGVSLTEAADTVFERLSRKLAAHPMGHTVDLREFKLEILWSGARFIKKCPELLDRLPENLFRKFIDLDRAGRQPILGRNSYGLYVRASRPETDTDETKVKEDPRPNTAPKFRQPVIYSCAQFVADLSPLDYLVDGILQRRFIYALTGKTGDGKTAVLILLAYCVASGTPFGSRDCEKGTVFVLVGENPDDVRMRWAGMAHEMKFSLDTIDIHFIPGVFPIDQIRTEIERATKAADKKISLLIVDTSAAYFSGQDENSNVQLGGHARTLREAFVGLPGQPCVVVSNHPTKNPDMENLLPRGGGAYLAEVDGNLVAIRNETTTTVHWHGKFRGPDFDPMAFELIEVHAPTLVDSKGRQIPTIIAKALDDAAHAKLRAKARDENATVLRILTTGIDMSLNDIAIETKWINRKGEPNKSRVRVVIDRLRKDKLVKLEQDTWALTESGQKAAKRAEQKQQKGDKW